MIYDTIVTLPAPITLRMTPPDATGEPIMQEFDSFTLYVRAELVERTLRAYLPPIPAPLDLYGPDDFAAACADTMEDHAARVLELLGIDPAATLQALIDGSELPPPPQRVPREVALWQAKAVMAGMGITAAVEAAIAAMPDPQRSVAQCAWANNAKLSRRGPTVAALAPALGLSGPQIDALFIQASALIV